MSDPWPVGLLFCVFFFVLFFLVPDPSTQVPFYHIQHYIGLNAKMLLACSVLNPIQFDMQHDDMLKTCNFLLRLCLWSITPQINWSMQMKLSGCQHTITSVLYLYHESNLINGYRDMTPDRWRDRPNISVDNMWILTKSF